MKNRLTFAHIISILLENKKKTYQQHQLVRSLFSAYLNDELPSDEIYAEDNTMYSRWCTGARPIPMEILRIYEENNFEVMEEDFQCKIIPNLINESQARSQMEELINDSRNTIGNKTADEMLAINDNAAFFTIAVRYAILSDHEHSGLFSPDLSDTIQNSRLPSITEEFVGRKNELKECGKLLQERSTLFISDVAGIGKSEFAKYYADKNRKKYTNIIYLYYAGDLKKSIAGMEFEDDTSEMTEETLFDRHYKTLKKLRHDSLIILDNFNVLPKDDSFFREFEQNDFQLLITTRCRPTQYPIMELKELDTDTELPELFYRLCPSAKKDALATKQIIQTVHSHTLTVVLSALSLSANGMEAEELLYELQTCGLSISSGEAVELYKDGDYTDGLMAEHLRKLLQLGKLSDPCLDVLRNLSLLSASGVLKNAFKNWLKLPSLNDVNYLAKYGFIHDDKENRKISLHPLIREIVALETLPSISNCHTLLDSLHCICLVHGLEVKRPQNVIDSLISITENILADIQEDYLLFLQDMFPYLEKYLVTDYLPKLAERIEYVMKQDTHSYCDRALLLDYKAELFLIKNDHKNALKKRLKAVSILEPYHTEDADQRTANLLSNLYNNLSNTYLLMKKTKEAAEMLHTALTIRQEYTHLGLAESHDMLQQLLNLTNMLILSKNTDMAKQVLSTYENLVLENEGTQTLDNGVCQIMYGAIALSEGNAKETELHLLSAENIISEVMGTDNDYAKTVYLYLNNLYSRWQKPEQALAYKNKYLECSHQR
ncbi:MAG: ATP-binding protein [Lachnospiraceae bacterium]|nr:ATP-binding protein [Lachnospiraceae bacterium]